MVLNAKAALTICLSCIGGMTWVLYGTEVPAIDVTSPLTPADVPVEVALGQTPAEEWTPTVADDGWRSELVQNFEEPSPVTATLADAEAAPMLEVAPPADVSAEEQAVALLLPSPQSEEPALTLVDESEPYESEPMEVADSGLPADGPDEWVAAAPEAEQAALVEYTVRRGDSLVRIAQREYGSRDFALVELLQDLNPLVKARGGQINIGETLVMPERAAALAWLDEADGGDFRLAADDGAAPRWYTVRRNDTLAKIAARYLDDADRWPEILKLNDKIKPHRIFPGMRIKLPPVVRMARS